MRQDANAGDGYHRFCPGIPTYSIGGIPIDRGDVRADGKDERT